MTRLDSSASLADIVVATGHVGYVWDLRADHIAWFGDWRLLFGPDRDLPPHNAKTLTSLIQPDDQYLVFGNSAAKFNREYRLRLSGNRIVWVHEQGITEFGENGALRQRGLLRVIDAAGRRGVASSHGVLERDPLTGKPNRAYLLAQIDRLLENAKDVRQLGAYLVVSIDKMAFLNEALGTQSADTVLCGMVERLAALLPTRALLGRVGGDMFGILLPGMTDETAPLAQRILENFRDHPLTTPSSAIHITVSIGSALLSGTGLTAAGLMIRAEHALHEARANGRNQYVEYQESEERAQQNRTELELGKRVKQALKQGTMRLAYQPVIDTQTGQVLFYEALARMFDDEGKLIPAAAFVPLIEQMGLALEFDRYILNMALREMEEHPTLQLAVNVSGLTAAGTGWPDYMQELLSQRPALARRLIIEITETAALVDVKETQRFVETLKRLGGRTALDDFGAGSTSISHLRTLALAIMKIDRELLLNLVGNEEQEHLVRMLINLARGLNIRTVAEGVETEEVAQWLRQEKADMMQGYYFGRPALGRPWLEVDSQPSNKKAPTETLKAPR